MAHPDHFGVWRKPRRPVGDDGLVELEMSIRDGQAPDAQERSARHRVPMAGACQMAVTGRQKVDKATIRAGPKGCNWPLRGLHGDDAAIAEMLAAAEQAEQGTAAIVADLMGGAEMNQAFCRPVWPGPELRTHRGRYRCARFFPSPSAMCAKEKPHQWADASIWVIARRSWRST